MANNLFQPTKDAEAVLADTITAIWSVNGNYSVQNNPGGGAVGSQVIVSGLSVSGTSVFHRVKPWETMGADEWRVSTARQDVIMTGGEASHPPFFRDCVAFYEIDLTDSKAYSGGNVRTIGGYTPPDPPPDPVDTPLSGTVTIGVALTKTALKEAFWAFYFSPGFNLINDSNSDPAADLDITFDNPEQMTVGSSPDFGKTWTYATPSGTGYPGYIVHSWAVNLSMAVSRS